MSPIAAFLQYLEHSSQLQYSFSLILLLFMLLLLSTLIISFKSSPTKKSINLPPSPPNKLPFIGHLHQLSPLPHHPLQTLAQKHGPLMLLHFGLLPTLVVSSPQAAKEIMKTHDLIFSSRPNLTIAKRLFYDKDLAFTPYGEYWRQMKRISILQLLSAKRVRSFQPVREEETQAMIQKIIGSSYSCHSSDQVVNLNQMVMTLTNDIICRVAFGKKYSGEEVGKRFGEILREMFYLLGAFDVKDSIPWLGWVNHFNGLNARVEKCFGEMDCFLERVIEDHNIAKKKREAGKDGGCGGKDDDDHHEYNEDFVDVLLGIEKDDSLGLFGNDSLGRDGIKGIILDMFVAGTDTSSSVVVWAMAELMRHPKLMRQVQHEVRKIAKGKTNVTEDDLKNMHYLQSIIKETLRLYPPLPLLVPRESTDDVKIQGYDIPAKTRVLINFYAIGRDPESWKEPNEFEPERFMNSSVDFKGNDFKFIPFGAGRRSCPGIAFTTATIELVLANLLFRFDWKLPAAGEAAGDVHGDIDMAETSGLVVSKKSPLLLVATDHFLSYCTTSQ